jgi:hypothetical protein
LTVGAQDEILKAVLVPEEGVGFIILPLCKVVAPRNKKVESIKQTIEQPMVGHQQEETPERCLLPDDDEDAWSNQSW